MKYWQNIQYMKLKWKGGNSNFCIAVGDAPETDR